jgi:ribose transport system substrate-binding protein
MLKRSLCAALMATGLAWGAAPAAHAEEILIGYSNDAMLNDIIVAQSKGFEDEMAALGKKLGKDIKVKLVSADGDVGRQSAQIRDLIALHPAAIFVFPIDSKAIVSSISAAEQENIPIVMYLRNSDPHASVRPTSFIGMDTFDQGHSAAKALFDQMKKDGVEARVINVMGGLHEENSVLRSAGMKKAAEEAGATVLQDVPTDWDPDKAMTGLSAALEAHPNATAVFVGGDHLIQGVSTALKRADRWAPHGDKKHIYLASQDVFPVAIGMISGGYIDADTVYDLGLTSKKAFDAVSDLLAGQKIDPEYLVKGRVATPENIATLPGLWSRK